MSKWVLILLLLTTNAYAGIQPGMDQAQLVEINGKKYPEFKHYQDVYVYAYRHSGDKKAIKLLENEVSRSRLLPLQK